MPTPTSLPKSLCLCKNLTYFEIQGVPGSGGLTGRLPSCLQDLSELQTLILRVNNLEGTVGSLPWKSLQTLDLSQNKLGGPLPKITDAPNLDFVDLTRNAFSRLPGLENCPLLTKFKAPDNRISETLEDILPVPKSARFTDADVGKDLTITGDHVKIDGQLYLAYWGDNQHDDCTGKIRSVEEKWKGKVRLEDGKEIENPAWVYKLNFLDLSNNAIHGTIPEDMLSRVPKLWSLELEHNQISGTIPEQVACGKGCCVDRRCKIDTQCSDSNTDVFDALKKYEAKNKNHEVEVSYDRTKACEKLERYCGEEQLEIGEIVRMHCRKMCGTTLQELRIRSNRLRSPLPQCLGGDQEFQECN